MPIRFEARRHDMGSLAGGVIALCIVGGCVGQVDAPTQERTGSPPAVGAGSLPANGAGGMGTSTGTSAPNGAGSGSGTPGSVGAGGACAPSPGPLALRRLNNAEYENTVVDLLGAGTGSAKGFLSDDSPLGFHNVSSVLAVPPIAAEQYGASAAALAGEAMKKVSTLAPCQAGATGAAEITCAEAFIRSFGKRAYRRPLTAAEVTAFSKIFQGERARTTYAAGIGIIVETMLQSPYFLYKTELGSGTSADRTLTPYEVATQLSYLVTGSMPDTELFAAADMGQLSTPDHLEGQVRRLFKSAKAKAWLRGFVLDWIGVTGVADVAKDPTVYANYDQSLRNAIVAESQSFVDAVLTEGNGSLSTLFGASWSYVDATLARHYGVARPPTGTAAQKIDLPVDQRAGILTQAAFLTAHSKAIDSFPIARGKYLRTRLFCRSLPPPPPNMMIAEPKPSTTMTTRERFAAHSAVQPCASCHRVIDPLGFGFENYDAIGAYRATENGKPIDASGEIIDVAPELDGPYRGAVELARKVAGSQVLRDCAARESYRWAMGRQETDAEQCLVKSLSGRLAGADPDLRELIVAIARTSTFALRSDR